MHSAEEILVNQRQTVVSILEFPPSGNRTELTKRNDLQVKQFYSLDNVFGFFFLCLLGFLCKQEV